MKDSERFSSNDPGRPAQNPVAQSPRLVGSPLPVGAAAPRAPIPPPFTPVPSESQSFSTPPAPPGRAFSSLPSPQNSSSLPNLSGDSPAEPPSSIQRAVNAVRGALPFVQRILPLLDGNFATVVANMLGPHQPATPPPPPVNLAPIEDSLAELQSQHRDLHAQVGEQTTSLKRFEDQLEMVREATDRNTLEQQELIEDLKGVGNKLNLISIFVVGLLAISVIVNVLLYLHIKQVLR